ncbi:disks large homolog 5 isoform X6 [Solenopsis invicta]|uniref:disks large homolog 5 isoform X6 n=1 Tax=Solenopsis invicta TaxID=13686 RepID=UPI00193CE015|nr:disks large homolog 5 isoform X6 [Solenopsis invicta]
MASGASSLDSAGSSDGALNMEGDSGSYGSVGSPVGGPECRSDYDGLQAQCDQAMHQLQLLRHKHSDTIRRCEITMKELEYYRGQHIAVMNQLEATSQESSSLRAKYGDLANDKQRLDREVQSLQKELSELQRMQNQEVLVTDAAGNDAMNQHYLSALRKYEAVKDEYDSLRKRYDDLIASHSSAVNKLELSQEEAKRLKKQYDSVLEERNSALRERNGLKQQCTAAIRQWDIALRERNEYREALSKVQQQHEEAVKEINQAMMLRMKASKDMKRLTEERNAALQEYSLIMGERDTVHKEIEKLGDDLSQAYSKVTHLETQNKQLVDEKKTLSYQIETLKREISSALQDRDEALKMCNELRQKFGDYSEGASRDYKHRLELNSLSHERDSVNKEAEKETNTRDYATRDKQRMDNLEQANLELDKLRKSVDTLQAELEEAIQEAEVSKRRRDWAFSERDKIVLERESIRTLCDRLRKERDRAVSELAGALRDSDDIKKQRNEASKELKDLKEKIEFGDHALRSSQLAQIDDSNDWEMIPIHVESGRICLDSDRGDLGLILVGGRDSPYYPNDTGVYVAQVTQGSALDGKLRVNDCIVRVNNVDCTSVSTRVILETLRSSTVNPATLIVKRRRITRRSLRTTQLSVGTVPHGITLELGIYISKISPGSLAAKDGNLAVGDRVLNINSKSMDTMTTAHEAMAILNDDTIDVLTITTLKGIPVPSADSSETMAIDGSFVAEKQKMVNSCSQTEQERMMLKASSDDYERRYLSTNFADRNVYKAAKSVSGEKSSGISNAWDNFREKIDIVRGRKHSKERDENKKKSHRNSSPNTFEQEQDAIAELDSVIDSYHKKASNSNNGVLKRSKRRGTEKIEKNGGTWPKARGGPLIQNGTEYTELEGSASSSSSEAGDGAVTGSRSGSPTPCNSPEVPRKSTVEILEPAEPERDATITITTTASTVTTTATAPTMSTLRVERDLRPSASLEVRSTQEREGLREMRPSASLDTSFNIRKPELRSAATLDRLNRAQMQRQNAMRSPTQEEQNRKPPPSGEPRYLLIETRKCSNLGISLVGGNGVGIFVHSVQPGCLAEEAGLFAGDRILEYNGVDLRQATAEQAALELARPADKVTMVSQYMPERYNEVKDKPGDSFYVKALFDRTSEVGDSLQLRFSKDDILYVDNTMFNGTPGHWRAWIVDQTGRRQTCGIIPSKFKVEEELLLRRSLGDLEQDTGKRSDTRARRSFFRRKKQQQRSSSSRDSCKELSHLTGVNLGWYSDSGTLNEDTLPASYQRVERLDYPTLRPVLIIGPLSECVVTKLLQEYPGQFTRCLAEAMHCSQSTLEQGLRDALYVDYRKKGSYFECTTVQAVKDICEKNTHCILDVSMASIERLHRHQIYPIVLLIKFKDRTQIKEVKDSRYPSDKISTKAAKEMFEHALKVEAEYKHYISAVIPAGVSVAYICTQVKASVDEEQSKALWIPRGGP